MITDWLNILCLALGLAAALVAGVFWGFSSFIMRGLREAEPAGGIAAMQGINRTVLRSEFLVSFLVLAPASMAFAVWAAFNLDGAAQRLIIMAAIVYVSTVLLVTVFGNVPMNQRLAGLRAGSAEAADYWPSYDRVWTRWNHVRSVGAMATAGLYLASAIVI